MGTQHVSAVPAFRVVGVVLGSDESITTEKHVTPWLSTAMVALPQL